MVTLKPSPRPRTHSDIHTGQIIQTVATVAILLATLFTAFSPTLFSNANFNAALAQFLTPQPAAIAAVPTSEQLIRIGIVSGHWGHDSGAVCDNGTTEQQVNLVIATLVAQKLTAYGYQVDLLQEFDQRLNGYKAAVLLSIHNDSCQYINDQATGFKVASALASRDPNSSDRLVACIRDRYERITGLPFHNSITPDMTQYHAFNEIDPDTTAAIIEAGFLYKDYNILTGHPDVIANGIVAGIQCFVNNENIAPESTPTP
ncbi:MAG TPA: N-acetylmuramoyl-L-alanine amidase [Anaerolineales bacterium]|nr:N-acetylmuramoyl-L-alanine amidase [Anaerolineales bacterium]